MLLALDQIRNRGKSEMDKMANYKILILGASYGSLLASKIMFGGHSVTLVCWPAEADLINSEGFRVRMPIRGQDPIVIDSRELPGEVSAADPDDVNPEQFDLIGLAMQEPQYGTQGVRGLLERIAASRVPCMSIMNMPPLPYIKRIKSVLSQTVEAAYTDPSVWSGFESGALTLCSPDPQAVRPPDERPNILQVTLPTNFKVARFDNEKSDAILERLERDIDAARFGTGNIEIPVKLRVHQSIFVPLAKWSMLLAGNYRCVTQDGMRTAEQAVHSNLDETRSVYEFVADVCVALGASREELVTFTKYADAAKSLSRPASVARALNSGAVNVERADKLVQLLARQKGMCHPVVDSIVELVDHRLNANRTHPKQ